MVYVQYMVITLRLNPTFLCCLCHSGARLMILSIQIQRNPYDSSFENQTELVDFFNKLSQLSCLWKIANFVMKINKHHFLDIIFGFVEVRFDSRFVSRDHLFSKWSIRYNYSFNQAFSPSAIFRRSVEIILTLTLPHFFAGFLILFLIS